MLYDNVVIFENLDGSPNKTVGKAGVAYLRDGQLHCVVVQWKGKSNSGSIFRKIIVKKKKRAPKVMNNLLAGDSYNYLIEIDRGSGVKSYFRANLKEAGVNTATFDLDQQQVQEELRSLRPRWQRAATPVVGIMIDDDSSELIDDRDINDLINDLSA